MRERARARAGGREGKRARASERARGRERTSRFEVEASQWDPSDSRRDAVTVGDDAAATCCWLVAAARRFAASTYSSCVASLVTQTSEPLNPVGSLIVCYTIISTNHLKKVSIHYKL